MPIAKKPSYDRATIPNLRTRVQREVEHCSGHSYISERFWGVHDLRARQFASKLSGFQIKDFAIVAMLKPRQSLRGKSMNKLGIENLRRGRDRLRNMKLWSNIGRESDCSAV